MPFNEPMRAFHPLCELIPPMAEDEFAELKKSIRSRGFDASLGKIVTLDGEILDGRSRYLACLEVGIAPVYATLPAGVDPAIFVLGANIHRRHLSAEQRALAVAEVTKFVEHGGDRKSDQDAPVPLDPPKTLAQAADLAGVSKRTMLDAKKVVAEVPEKVKEIRAGKTSLKKEAARLRTPSESVEEKPEVTKPRDAILKPEEAREPAFELTPDESVAEEPVQLCLDLDWTNPHGVEAHIGNRFQPEYLGDMYGLLNPEHTFVEAVQVLRDHFNRVCKEHAQRVERLAEEKSALRAQLSRRKPKANKSVDDPEALVRAKRSSSGDELRAKFSGLFVTDK